MFKKYTDIHGIFAQRGGRKYVELLDYKEEGNFVTLSLKKPADLQIQPGQYINLYSTWLPREFQKNLPLAVASGSEEDTLQVTYKKGHILSAKGGLSLFPIGTKLLIDGPHGNGLDLSTTYKNKKPLLLIGAGSAITTIRNVVHSISKDQECNILYSAKSIKDIPYLDEVNQWKMNPNNYFSLTQEASPDFHHGRINSHLEMRNITGNTNILLCGPDSFIRETALLLLEKHGHEKENIFVSLNDKNAKDGPIYQLTDAILERLKPTISEDAEDSAKKKRLSNS